MIDLLDRDIQAEPDRGHLSPTAACRTSRRRGMPTVGLLAVVLYLLGAWVIYLPLGIADTSHLPGCVCGDQVNQVWFLSWVQSSLAHGNLRFWTRLLDYPAGVNVLDNASFPLLGVLMAPVTTLLGPVAAFALLLRLGFFLSAMAAFWTLRRVVRSPAAAVVGGAVYAFSPYMAHQGASHMFLVFVPLPPIMFRIIHGQFTGLDRRRPFRRGLVVGSLGLAQYFIASEILVSTALIVSVVLIVLGLLELAHHRSVVVHARVALRMGCGALVAAGPLLAYPAWFALAGPQHVSGPTQSVTAPGIDVLSTLLPVDHGVAAGWWHPWTTPAVPMLGDTAYLGIPVLLVVVVLVAIKQWRVAVVRAAAVTGVLAWILALGPRLVVHDHVTAIPLPFAVLTHLPVLQDVIPSRLTLYVDLAAAVLLAVALDGLIRTRHDRSPTRRLGLIGLAVSIALCTPTARYPAVGIGPAKTFVTPATRSALPANGAVLAYPYPVFPEDQAMLWQALSRMRFSLLGGYAVRPLGSHGATKVPPLLSPSAVPSVLFQAWPDNQIPTNSDHSFLQAVAQLPEFVRDHHVTALIVQASGQNPQQVVKMFTAVYGPAHRLNASIYLWRTGG